MEVVESKEAKTLCQIICEVLREKGVDINQLRFDGFDGTNTMSGEISGLQRRLQRLVTHAKYVNCRNHRLALVFVYLISKFQVLADVDVLILAVWKLMKYSSVKASVFGAAQTVEGLKTIKLLKAAPTCWLSHGDASQRLVSRFKPLVNCSDTLIIDSRAQDVKDVRDELLEPNTILMLQLLADVLVHVNRFSRYLQTHNLIFATLVRKFGKLVESTQYLAENDGPSFSEHAVQFLTVATERMA